MTDLRRISLDIGAPGAEADGKPAHGDAAPDPELVAQFRRSLAGEPPAPAREPAGLQDVQDAIARMLVSGQAGERAVRIRLQQELLPGTELAVREAEGKLLVEFDVQDAAVLARLEGAAPEMAALLAQRLDRVVRLVLARAGEVVLEREAAPGDAGGLPPGPASLLGGGAR